MDCAFEWTYSKQLLNFSFWVQIEFEFRFFYAHCLGVSLVAHRLIEPLSFEVFAGVVGAIVRVYGRTDDRYWHGLEDIDSQDST